MLRTGRGGRQRESADAKPGAAWRSVSVEPKVWSSASMSSRSMSTAGAKALQDMTT